MNGTKRVLVATIIFPPNINNQPLRLADMHANTHTYIYKHMYREQLCLDKPIVYKD